MAGNSTLVIDLEDDSEENDSEEETKADTTQQSGVSAKMDGLADKDPKGDSTTTQPEDLTCCCVMCCPDMTAKDAAAFLRVNVDECNRTERGELVVAEEASPSGDHKNSEDVSSARTLRRSPQSREESRLKANASRAKRKLEATLSGTLLTCYLCPYKTCYSGVMSRHIQAHAHYQLCSCDFCDFQCHGVELIDKHVIENHLTEIVSQSTKGKKKKTANAQKPPEALPSNPLVNVGPSLDLLGRRHRYNLNKGANATSDVLPSTLAQKEPYRKIEKPSRIVTHKRKAVTNTISHEDSAKGLSLIRLSNELAKKLNAPFTVVHEDHVKIRTPVALPQDASSKQSMRLDLPRHSSNQVGRDCADVTTEEQSGTLVEAEQDELSRESSPQHMPIKSVAGHADVTTEEQSGTLVEAEQDELSRESSPQHMPIKSVAGHAEVTTEEESGTLVEAGQDELFRESSPQHMQIKSVAGYAEVATEEQSGALVEAEQDELSKESSLHHRRMTVTAQSLTSQTNLESNSNTLSNAQSTSSQLTPPKKRKMSDDQSGLSDLLKKAPWNSSKVTSSEPSEDVVAAELREYVLLRKQVAGNEQAEASGESLVNTKNGTSTQPYAHMQSSPSAKKNTPKVISRSKKPTSNQKLLACSECAFTSSKPQQLTQHMKTHTKIEPYLCDFCDFKACGSHSLRKHMIKHTPSVVTNQKEITAGYKTWKSSKTGSEKF